MHIAFWLDLQTSGGFAVNSRLSFFLAFESNGKKIIRFLVLIKRLFSLKPAGFGFVARFPTFWFGLETTVLAFVLNCKKHPPFSPTPTSPLVWFGKKSVESIAGLGIHSSVFGSNRSFFAKK